MRKKQQEIINIKIQVGECLTSEDRAIRNGTDDIDVNLYNKDEDNTIFEIHKHEPCSFGKFQLHNKNAIMNELKKLKIETGDITELFNEYSFNSEQHIYDRNQDIKIDPELQIKLDLKVEGRLREHICNSPIYNVDKPMKNIRISEESHDIDFVLLDLENAKKDKGKYFEDLYKDLSLRYLCNLSDLSNVYGPDAVPSDMDILNDMFCVNKPEQSCVDGIMNSPIVEKVEYIDTLMFVYLNSAIDKVQMRMMCYNATSVSCVCHGYHDVDKSIYVLSLEEMTNDSQYMYTDTYAKSTQYQSCENSYWSTSVY